MNPISCRVLAVLLLVGPVCAQDADERLAGLERRVAALEQQNEALVQRVQALEAMLAALTQRPADARAGGRPIDVAADGPRVRSFRGSTPPASSPRMTATLVIEDVRPVAGEGGSFWVLGWDGARDVAVYFSGPMGQAPIRAQYERMKGRWLRCDGQVIDASGEDEETAFVTLFPLNLSVLPGGPAGVDERTRPPRWKAEQPDGKQWPRSPARAERSGDGGARGRGDVPPH